MIRLKYHLIIYIISYSLFLLLVDSMDIPRKSDPMSDKENMLDTPLEDPTIIPTHLIMFQEDPSLMNDAPGDPLNPTDFTDAEKLNIITFDEGVDDPIFIAGLFQGDIQLTSPDDIFQLTAHTAAFNDDVNATGFRNAIIDNNKRWPNAEIPYVISSSFNKDERMRIAKAMQSYHQRTCIKFTSRTSQKDYIHITKGSGCSSSVGRVGGRQTVSLGQGCVYHGVIIHELMHASGFWHEQSRADRDKYVRIHWSNIQHGMAYNFQRYDWNIIQHLGVPYDPASVMHYGKTAFARDRSKPTIETLSGEEIGQRQKFSQKDMLKLNKLYQCSGYGGTTTTTATTVKPPPIPVPDNCIDNNVHCPYWSKSGECEKNPTWMGPNCKKSCNKCGKCEDDNKTCSGWKAQGHCSSKYQDYMEIHCKRSCNLCGGGPTGPIKKKCTDDNKYCTDWAQIGECTKNPEYMKKKCKKSCKTC